MMEKPPVAVDDEVLRQLSDLHPEGSQGIPFPQNNFRPVDYRVKHMCKGIASIKAAAAPGFDGWSPALLHRTCGIDPSSTLAERDSAAEGGDNKEDEGFVQSPLTMTLLRITRDLLGNKFPETLWFRSARLLARKKEPVGVRPIAVGPAFVRAISSGLLIAEPLRDRVSVMQYGVGRGAEAMVHRLRAKLQHQRPAAVFKLDLANAFNRVDRHAIARAAAKDARPIYNFLCWRYGTPSDLLVLRQGGGVSIIPSSQGVQQGDNMGTALFTLALAPRLQQLVEIVPEIDPDAYADDIAGTIMGGAQVEEVMGRVMGVVTSEDWRRDGFHINAQKTIVRTPAQLEGQPIKVAGAWIGGDAAVAANLMEELERELPPKTVVRQLPTHMALLVLRMCLLPLVSHHLRTTPPHVVAAAAAHFDSWILEQLGAIMGTPGFGATATTVAQLPLREGGLGLLPQQEISQLAYDAAVVSAILELARCAAARETLLQYAGSRAPTEGALVDAMRLHHHDSLNRVAEALGETRDVFDRRSRIEKGLQRKLTVQWGEERWLNLFLAQTSRTDQHRLADQSSRLSRAWMSSLPTPSNPHLDDAIVLLSLRNRLDVDMGLYQSFAPSRNCRVCPDAWSPTHAPACRDNSPAVTARHEAYKSAFRSLWQRAAYPVTMEFAMPEPEGGGGGRAGRRGGGAADAGDDEQPGGLMDLRVEDGERATVLLYDVTFCSPQPLRARGDPDAPVTREELEERRNAIEQGKSATRVAPKDGAAALQEESLVREAAIDLLVGPALRAADEKKKRRYTEAVNRLKQQSPQDAVSFTPLSFSSAGACSSGVVKTIRLLVDAIAREEGRQAATPWAAPSKAGVMRLVTGILSRLLVTCSAAFFGGVVRRGGH